MKILPLAYIGSLEWWQEALSPDAVIDVGENYIKQSCRNRAEIATADGRMSLTANVVKGASIHKKAVKDMRLDYSKRWQHQHAVAIRSAYKSSPYYDHFAHYFEPLFERRWEFLYDMNREFLEAVRKAGGIGQQLRFVEHYVRASEGDLDLRSHNFLGPRTEGPFAEPYWQVFSERMPFESNCTMLDYIFNEGKL